MKAIIDLFSFFYSFIPLVLCLYSCNSIQLLAYVLVLHCLLRSKLRWYSLCAQIAIYYGTNSLRLYLMQLNNPYQLSEVVKD